ncbi:MAG: hypothetical protein HJJLKODD_01246 [Phycisphaerae bacterium]|nr:hypothetical protein [Phycisphaerae bacterium]
MMIKARRCDFGWLMVGLLMVGPVWAADPVDQEQRYVRAEEQLRAGPPTATAWMDLLDSLYRLDRPVQALAAARTALQWTGVTPELKGYIARALFRSGLLDDAARLIDEIPKDQRKNPTTALVWVRLLHAQGQTENALALTRQLLIDHPDDAELLYEVALLSGHLGRNHEARRYYEQAGAAVAQLSGYPADLISARSAGGSAIFLALGQAQFNAILHTGEAPLVKHPQLNLPVVQVRLNQQETVTMLLDLGGGDRLSLDDELAKKCGVKLLSDAQVSDLSGEGSQVQVGLVGEVQLAGISLQQVPALAYKFDQQQLPGIQGVVGLGIFNRGRVTVDFERAVLHLEISAGREDDPTRPSDDSPLPSGYDQMKVRFIDGYQLLLPVQVQDQLINALIDMGTPLSCFSTQLLSALKKPEDIGDTLLGETPAKVSSSLSFKLGRREFTSDPAVALPFIGGLTSSEIGTQIDLVLGWNALAQMAVLVIDQPAGEVLIKWQQDKSPPTSAPASAPTSQP